MSELAQMARTVLAQRPSLLVEARGALDSSSVSLIDRYRRSVRGAIGRCKMVVNNARLESYDDQNIRAVGALLDELNAVAALLLQSYQDADAWQRKRFQDAVGRIVARELGEDTRKRWWKEAGEMVEDEEQRRIGRTMSPGSAVSLGSVGGSRRRKGE